MASETIDQLMVKLGLETDQQQFQQAEAQFSSLQSTVLQVGAAIGTGLGINELTVEWARGIDEMAKKAEVLEGSGVTPQFISQMQGAFALIRGDAEEAIPFIEQMVRLLEDVDWGEINDSALARGLDLSGLQEAETAREAMMALQEVFQQIEDPQRQERLSNAIGLSDDATRLLMGDDIGSIMARAEELRPMTDEMVESAEEFTRGWAELSRAMTSLKDQISVSFVGDLGTGMSDIADAIAENREEIESFWNEAKPILTGMAASLTVMATLRASQAGLGILSKIPGATLAAGAVGGIIYDRAQDSDYGTRSMENFRELGRLIGVVDPEEQSSSGPAMEFENGVPQIQGPDRDMSALRELNRDIQRNLDPEEQSSSGPAMEFENGVPQIQGPDRDMSALRELNRDIQRNEFNYEINIDARGATDPEQVRRAGEEGARRVMEEAADNTREDTRSEAQ